MSTGASNAVDGNTTTCTRQTDIGTNSKFKTLWWKVDLGGVYSIYSIDILFKNYTGYGMYSITNTHICLLTMQFFNVKFCLVRHREEKLPSDISLNYS